MSILRPAALAVLPLLAGVALAQTPPPAPKAPTPPTVPGMSAQGAAIAQAKIHADDAALKQVFLQMRSVSQQIQLEAQRPVINVDLLGQLVKKLDVLQEQFRGKQSDAMIATLRALPVSDRAPFLKAIGLGAKPAPVPGAPGAPGAPTAPSGR